MNTNKTVIITGSSKNLTIISQFYLEKKFNVIGISKKTKSKINKNSYICDLSNESKTLSLFKNKIKI